MGCNSTNDRRKERQNIRQELPENETMKNEMDPNLNGNQMNEFNDNPEQQNMDYNENGNYNDNMNDNMNYNNLDGNQNNNNNNIDYNNNTNDNNNNLDYNNNNNNNYNDNMNYNNNDYNNYNNNNDYNNNYNNYNNNYNLICPHCSMRSPHIEKIYYDENNKDFIVKYTCICQENPKEAKKIPLQNLLSNKEPINTCNIHQNNKLISFCRDCHIAICNICKNELHKGHSLEDNNNNNINKKDADYMLELIKQKEQQFNYEINQNEARMENGLDNMIQKLNNEKINYKKQLENYKDNNLKTFEFLKNLYGKYINNIIKNENYNNNMNPNNSPDNLDNNENDIMLVNHIKKFTIDNNIPKLNSNVDEILNQFNNKQKELKLKYDYGFPNYNNYSMDFSQNKISESNTYISKYEYTCSKTFKGHIEKIVSLIQLSSGKLASGSYDNTVRIWNMDTLKEDKIINERGRVFALLEFERDKLLTGTSQNVINIWDLNSNKYRCEFSFSGHELWINCLEKINDYYFASASNDARIKIWDYPKRQFLYDLCGHKDCILSLIVLRNNCLCSGSADLTIKIWDWEKRRCISSLEGHERWVKCVFELDNGILVSGSDDKTIKLWKNNNLISTLKEHEHSVRSFCQINSNYFASGSFDCTIKIWNINTLDCVQTITGHSSNIICIIYLHNKRGYVNKRNSIASCSNDKTIKVWDLIP